MQNQTWLEPESSQASRLPLTPAKKKHDDFSNGIKSREPQVEYVSREPQYVVPF